MKTMIKIFTGVFLFLFVSACSEAEQALKEPSELRFTFELNRKTNSSNSLLFNKGFIILAAFDFEGERETGTDVYFSREFTSGLNVKLDSTTEIPELNFNIPQGVYNRIAISFETFDDFDQNCLVVEGTFTNAENVGTPLRFEFKSSEYWEIVAEDYSGASQIVIDADVPAISEIELDPVYWFDTVTYAMFEEAERITIDGKPTILVNENINTDIFELVVDRIDESTECYFNSKK